MNDVQVDQAIIENTPQGNIMEKIIKLNQTPGLWKVTQRFNLQLLCQAHFLTAGQGSTSISRKAVKKIVLHYYREVFKPRYMLQRKQILNISGRSIGLDFTYKGTTSLTGADDAYTSSQRRKCASFGASLATATVEHGFVVAAEMEKERVGAEE